jgi:hypothetical protein
MMNTVFRRHGNMKYDGAEGTEIIGEKKYAREP